MRKMVVIGAGALILISSPASAGTVFHGYGETKLAAMNEANRLAAEFAAEHDTCYDRAKPENCVLNSGVWDCYADAANHRGSCGKY